MIPALATIVGAYVIFRMVETFLFSSSRYSSRATHILAGVLALLVALITLASLVGIYSAALVP